MKGMGACSMRIDPLLRRLDRLAGGRHADRTIAPELREHPSTRRAFVVITWLLVVEFLIGATAVAIAIALQLTGQPVQWAVWMRSAVVLGMSFTLFYFAWRSPGGFYWGYSRLRYFCKVFPIVS